MNRSFALAPGFVQRAPAASRFLVATALWLLGVGALCAMAQISIRLPWTPVPITGQTFGVYALSLLWGGTLGPLSVAAYLGLGALGLPVFAAGAAGLTWGPTVGYLAGMLLASLVLGRLADRGWSRKRPRAFAACVIGSLCVFSCGLFVLSFFVPAGLLLKAGLWPFLPGDIVKNLLAASLVTKISQR